MLKSYTCMNCTAKYLQNLVATRIVFCILHISILIASQSTTQVGNFNRTKFQRIAGIQNLLESYKAAHNVTVLSSSSSELCSRRFIPSTAACRDAGNGIGIFLDNLAWAVLLNRTIVLVWNKFTNFCEKSLQVQDWVIRKDVLDKLLVSAGCPLRSSHHAGVYRVGGRERAIRCCNVEGINATWLSPGNTAKHAHLLLQPLGGAARVVSTAAEKRFALLFPTRHSTNSNNDPTTSNRDYEDTNREIVSFETYGVLAAFSFDFTSVARALTEPVVNSIYKDPRRPKPITIAMQIRHQRLNQTLERMIDDGMEVCLRHILQAVRSRSSGGSIRSCAVLLASDRPSTILRMTRAIEDMNCSAHMVPRGMNKLEARGEHGPWGDSKLSMADWLFLGHADYFLGSQISSYSTLIANSIAARRMLRSGDDDEEIFLWGMLVHRMIHSKALLSQPPHGTGTGSLDDLGLPSYCTAYRDKGVEIRRNCSLSRNYYNYQTQRCELVDRKDGL